MERIKHLAMPLEQAKALREKYPGFSVQFFQGTFIGSAGQGQLGSVYKRRHERDRVEQFVQAITDGAITVPDTLTQAQAEKLTIMGIPRDLWGDRRILTRADWNQSDKVRDLDWAEVCRLYYDEMRTAKDVGERLGVSGHVISSTLNGNLTPELQEKYKDHPRGVDRLNHPVLKAREEARFKESRGKRRKINRDAFK